MITENIVSASTSHQQKKHKIIKQNNKEAKSQQQYNVVACRTVMLLPLVVEGLWIVANQQTNGYWDGQRHVVKVRYKLLSVKQQQEQPERQLQQHCPTTTTSTSEENMSERTFFHEILPWGRYNFDAFTTSRVSVIIGSLCLRFHYNTPVFLVDVVVVLLLLFCCCWTIIDCWIKLKYRQTVRRTYG